MVFPFTQGPGGDSCRSIRHALLSRDSELSRAKIPRSPSGMGTARRHGSVGQSHVLRDKLTRGVTRVETVELAHQYLHLSGLVGKA